MFISDSQLEEIKSKIDIVDIISQVTSLKASGKSLKGLCPFHQEKTPSFFVDRIKQSFNCFGCGTNGDIFSFIMKNEGLNFLETVKKLANIAGVALSEEKTDDVLSKKIENLYRMNYDASIYFQNKLKSNEGKVAKEYIKSRGIPENIIESFSIGYAIDSWDSIYEYLKSKGYSDSLILESGLCILSDKNQKLYDRFRGRLMFPVLNTSSKTTGFSGRIIIKTTDESAKYVNSPESFIFKKKELLYGMHIAKPFISKNDQIILAEGHIDVLALHSHGYSNSVGVQGTAFSLDHAKWISKYTKNVQIIFDGDTAGINAAIRILPIAFTYNLNCKITILPENHDPASFLKEKGKDAFNDFLNKSDSLFEFKIKHLLKNKELTPETLVSISEQILDDLKEVKNPILKDSLIKILASYLKVSPNSIESEFSRQKNKKNFFNKNLDSDIKTSNISLLKLLSSLEKELLKLIFSSDKTHRLIFETVDFEWIEHKECMLIFDMCFKLYLEKHLTINDLTYLKKEFNDEKMYLELIEWAMNSDVDKNKILQAAEETINQLEIEYYTRKLKALKSMLGKTETKNDNQKKLQLMQEQDILIKKRFLKTSNKKL